MVYILFFSRVQGQRVRFKKYGCFSKAPPFDNVFVKLPEAPNEIRTTFNLFTRPKSGASELIDDNDKRKLKDSSFDIFKTTILVVHGFTGKIIPDSVIL